MPEIFHGQELPIKVFRDGDSWCALLGENLQEGRAAFGKKPSEAMLFLELQLDNDEALNTIQALILAAERCADQLEQVGDHRKDGVYVRDVRDTVAIVKQRFGFAK